MTASLATPTELVWNKGIAALCDWRIPDEFPQGRYSQVSTEAGSRLTSKTPDNLIGNPHLFSGIREGDLVWVRLAWLKSFIAQALPFVRENFVLVTGDSDTTVPSEVSVAEHIIRHPRILHWYTQNYDGHYSKKISPIPIGIDFHTLSERAFWGEERSDCVAQEQTLLSIRERLPPVEDRIPNIYSDFAWQPRVDGSLADRRALHKHIRPDLLVKQSKTMARSEMWRNRGKYAFVLSAPGIGLDCHRTWETLALGHIVVSLSSPLNPLYSGLPVCVVRSWDELTHEKLEEWLALYKDWDPARCPQLTTRYWVDWMRSSRIKMPAERVHSFDTIGFGPMPRRIGPSLQGLITRSTKHVRRIGAGSRA